MRSSFHIGLRGGKISMTALRQSVEGAMFKDNYFRATDTQLSKLFYNVLFQSYS